MYLKGGEVTWLANDIDNTPRRSSPRCLSAPQPYAHKVLSPGRWPTGRAEHKMTPVELPSMSFCFLNSHPRWLPYTVGEMLPQLPSLSIGLSSWILSCLFSWWQDRWPSPLPEETSGWRNTYSLAVGGLPCRPSPWYPLTLHGRGPYTSLGTSVSPEAHDHLVPSPSSSARAWGAGESMWGSGGTSSTPLWSSLGKKHPFTSGGLLPDTLFFNI